MFHKVLIANRGEIAVRIARTLRAMRIGVVAMYSDADRDALHVQTADEAYRVGPAPVLESYLNIPAVLDAAKRSGAEAIHPGYGFLSENPAFAEAVTDAGLVFIGPPPTAIRAMGDKAGAKRLMEAAGVPIIPGYTGDIPSDAVLAAEAGRVGFPLLIKAVAGGGGMGMREVHAAEEFAEALAAARRTAYHAFGDDRMLLERLLVRPRHVEVQIMADTYGAVVAFGERECSIQRRHQKVIEESPSAVVTPDLRARLYAAATLAATVAGYVNAGTVEFLLDPQGDFYFLEMNTRLQVEHPVTEVVTGFDLVRLQLEIAAGWPLPITSADVALSGHAIESRIYAEDPERDYLPQTGVVTGLAEPDMPGLRVDSALYTGAAVTPFYDPLLAKVITHGATRDEAIARMADALAGYRIDGVVTNLAQLRAILATDAFHAAATHTGFLTEHWHPGAATAIPRDILLAITGYEATRHRWPDPPGTSPWQSLGPLRFGSAELRGVFTVNGSACTIEARRNPDGDSWHVIAAQAQNGQSLLWGTGATELGRTILADNVRFDRPTRDRLLIRHDKSSTLAVSLAATGAGGVTVRMHDRTYRVMRVGLPTPEEIVVAGGSGTGRGASELTAPLTGIVTRVLVAVGEAVQARQPLIVLEAMKMEHAIVAPFPGRVGAVHVSQGDRVTGGAMLVGLVEAQA